MDEAPHRHLAQEKTMGLPPQQQGKQYVMEQPATLREFVTDLKASVASMNDDEQITMEAGAIKRLIAQIDLVPLSVSEKRVVEFEDAWQHFREHLDHYLDLIDPAKQGELGGPKVAITPALSMVFLPLIGRVERGDRSEDLIRELRAVE